jgi:hypothetical protein
MSRKFNLSIFSSINAEKRLSLQDLHFTAKKAGLTNPYLSAQRNRADD